MSRIAIIPARGGSQRIPRKNIKLFHGKPIIAYSIEAALASGLFDEVMVSTDDEEIASIAQKYGAKVPFMRSKENANHFATTYQVIQEVIHMYASQGRHFDYTACIYATAPFVTPEKLQEANRLLESKKLEAVYTVLPFSYPVQRGLHETAEGLKMKWPQNKTVRSQDLEKMYHDAGQFYIYHTQTYLSKKGVFNMYSSGIVLNELEAQDIDTEMDWKLAELKFGLKG